MKQISFFIFLTITNNLITINYLFLEFSEVSVIVVKNKSYFRDSVCVYRQTGFKYNILIFLYEELLNLLR